MEIKCPKCRFRFEVDCPQGVRTLSCVCPRCGTPFAHELPTAADATAAAPSATDDKGVPSVQQPVRTGADKSGWDGMAPDSPARYPWEQPRLQGGSTSSDHSADTSSKDRLSFDTPRRTAQHRFLASCSMRGAFLAVLFCFMFYVVFLRGCSTDEPPVDESLSEPTTVVEEPEDTFAAPLKKYDVSHAKPTPDWMFGTWQRKTSYGLIEIRLAGKWIRETLDGKTEHGTFFYSPGQVNCIFNGRDTFIYRVDDVRRRIDAGNGMWMDRVGK